jgi:heme/copper-type cytochrome/quinol oxidase subunit 2
MIEWQSESSLFTLRIRGKQWYWVYKIELKALTDISNTMKNIGRNHYSSELSFDNNDLFFVKFKHDLMYNYLSWNGVLEENSNTITNSSTYVGNSLSSGLGTKPSTLASISSSFVPSTSSLALTTPNDFYASRNVFLRGLYNNGSFTLKTANLQDFKVTSLSSGISSVDPKIVTRVDKLTTGYKPLRLLSSGNSLTVSFTESNYIKKPFNNNLFLVIKQKRFSSPNFNTNRGVFQENSFDYKGLSLKNFNTYLNEHFNMDGFKSPINNKRLLRTRRILVLPTKTNITLITNSFDVMHSWYIPGLGVKLDCVPGRSTHHVIHIDHTGFYYGQCAEICGRYHHHMPIRVCALPFNHFILWWWNYGAPFFLQRRGDRISQVNNSLRQFNW